jgi:hypothetical protein
VQEIGNKPSEQWKTLLKLGMWKTVNPIEVRNVGMLFGECQGCHCVHAFVMMQ